MASNLADALLPFDGTATTFQPESPHLQLPLTPDQIREHVQRFEENLTTASDVLTSRGVTLLDFKVIITYLDLDQKLARFLTTRVAKATDVEVDTGSDHPPNPTADTSALPMTNHKDDGRTFEAALADLTIPETDADDYEDASLSNWASTPPKSRCKICMEELAPEATIRINCGCTYCSTCLNDFIMHSLSSRSHYPARCCSAEGIDIRDTAPYLKSEVIRRWSKVEVEYKERLPMYCQNKECSAHIPKGRLGGENKFVDCKYCQTDTCKKCKQWRYEHSGLDMDVCPEDIMSKEDRKLANSEKWKQCPGCKNLLERSAGCNNMQCECGTEFCYDCGIEYSPDHRCGCQTSPDADGWHYRVGEIPHDLADGAIDDEYIEMLGHLLARIDEQGHGPFDDAANAATWLWYHVDTDNESIIWDDMDEDEFIPWRGLEVGDEETRVFQAYERVLQE